MSSNHSLRLLLLPLSISLFTGCTVLPGNTLSLDGATQVPTPAEPADAPATLEGIKVNVFPITPRFLAAMPPAKPVLPQANPALQAELDRYEYKVGAGDVLTVTVWDHPEFQGGASLSGGGSSGLSALIASAPTGGQSGGASALSLPNSQQMPDTLRPQGLSVQVQRDGYMYFPFVGRLQVAGKTVPTLRDQISRSLARYIQSPQVDVAVSAFRSQRVYMTGDIGKAGSLPITTEPLTLFDAITQVGITPAPDLEKVSLIRANGETRFYSLERLFRNGDASQNVLLRDGDVLHFPRNDSRKVFVLGEITNRMQAMPNARGGAGIVPIGSDGLTLAAALAGAGGLDQLAANPRGVFVMRPSAAGGDQAIDVYQLDLSEATAYVMADRFPLQSRDFVYVTAAPIVRFNRVMQQILPSIANLFFLKQIGGN